MAAGAEGGAEAEAEAGAGATAAAAATTIKPCVQILGQISHSSPDGAPNGTAVDQLQSQLQVGVMKAPRLTATDVPFTMEHGQWPTARFPAFSHLTLSRCAV